MRQYDLIWEQANEISLMERQSEERTWQFYREVEGIEARLREKMPEPPLPEVPENYVVLGLLHSIKDQMNRFEANKLVGKQPLNILTENFTEQKLILNKLMARLDTISQLL